MSAHRVDDRGRIGATGLFVVLALLALAFYLGRVTAPPPSQVMDPAIEQLGSVTTVMSSEDPVALDLLDEGNTAK